MKQGEGSITLQVPAEEKALLVVRMTTAGVLAGRGLDVETMEDLKTAVYEACYALLHQRKHPERLEIAFCGEGVFRAQVRCVGERRETGEREIDEKLCRAVLETVVPGVELCPGDEGVDAIRLWQDEGLEG